MRRHEKVIRQMEATMSSLTSQTEPMASDARDGDIACRPVLGGRSKSKETAS